MYRNNELTKSPEKIFHVIDIDDIRTILKRYKRRTLTNGSKNKKINDYAQGPTSEKDYICQENEEECSLALRIAQMHQHYVSRNTLKRAKKDDLQGQ